MDEAEQAARAGEAWRAMEDVCPTFGGPTQSCGCPDCDEWGAIIDA